MTTSWLQFLRNIGHRTGSIHCIRHMISLWITAHIFEKSGSIQKRPQVMRASTISLGVVPKTLQVIKTLNEGNMKQSKVHSPDLNLSNLKETLAGELFFFLNNKMSDGSEAVSLLNAVTVRTFQRLMLLHQTQQCIAQNPSLNSYMGRRLGRGCFK